MMGERVFLSVEEGCAKVYVCRYCLAGYLCTMWKEKASAGVSVTEFLDSSVRQVWYGRRLGRVGRVGFWACRVLLRWVLVPFAYNYLGIVDSVGKGAVVPGILNFKSCHHPRAAYVYVAYSIILPKGLGQCFILNYNSGSLLRVVVSHIAMRTNCRILSPSDPDLIYISPLWGISSSSPYTR